MTGTDIKKNTVSQLRLTAMIYALYIFLRPFVGQRQIKLEVLGTF